MHQLMRQGLGAWAEGESRDELGAGVAGDPPCRLPCGQTQGERQPGGLGRPVQLEAEFVELDVSQLQGAHEAVMQGLGMPAGA